MLNTDSGNKTTYEMPEAALMSMISVIGKKRSPSLSFSLKVYK
jgi:hypothetical protein